MGLMEGGLNFKYSENRIRLLTIAAILLSFSLTLAILLAHNQPATGYEVSIYSGTTTTVWVILSLSMVGSIAIILSGIYGLEIGKRLTIGASIISFLSFCSIIGLLIIRGYFAWTLNGDPATHLALVDQAIRSGNLTVWNPYPILHLFSIEMSLMADIDLLYLHLFLPFVMGSLTPIFYYVLANQVFHNRQVSLLVALLSMLLSQGWFINFTPNHLANLVFPLFLFIIIKHASSPSIGTAAIAVIGVLTMSLMHPVAMIGLVLFMTVFITYYDQKEKPSILSFLLKYNPVILSVVLMIYWNRVKSTVQLSIIEQSGTGTIVVPQEPTPLLSMIEHSLTLLFQFFDLLILQNAPVLLFILCAVVFFIIIRLDGPLQTPHKTVLVSLVAIIAAMMLMIQFDVGFNPLRLVPAMMVILIVIVGALLNHLKSLAKNPKEHKDNFGLALVVVLLVFFQGISTVYPSETNNQSNNQTTGTEVAGFHWTFNNGETDYELSSITLSPFRFAQFLYYDYEGGVWDAPFTGNPSPPAHFGYYENYSLSSYYETRTYLLLGERDRVFSASVFPFHLFSDNEFARLNFDPYVNVVYSSAGFNTLLID